MSNYEDWATKYLDIRSLSFREANVVCPFHSDHAPSLRFNLDSGLWFCHGCQESGNIDKMADKMGVPSPSEDAVTIDDLSTLIDTLVQEQESKTERSKLRNKSWLKMFTASTKDIDEFWVDERMVSRKVVKEFHLGIDFHNEAATIPIASYDSPDMYYGVIRRFTGKVSGNRYLNPTNFQKSEHVLFLERVTGSTVALTEGPIDALRCWSAGIPAVSVFGSSMSQAQASMMRRHGVNTVVSFFDNDAPGRVGTMKNDQRFQGTGIMHYTVDWTPWVTGARDPGDCSDSQLKEMYRDAIPFFRWQT